MWHRLVEHRPPVCQKPDGGESLRTLPTLTGFEKTWAVSKISLLGLRRALAVRIGGRLVGRVTAPLRLGGFFERGRMIAFAMQLGGGLMRLGSGAMILGGFRVGGHWHRVSPDGCLCASTVVYWEAGLQSPSAAHLPLADAMLSGEGSESTQAEGARTLGSLLRYAVHS